MKAVILVEQLLDGIDTYLFGRRRGEVLGETGVAKLHNATSAQTNMTKDCIMMMIRQRQ